MKKIKNDIKENKFERVYLIYGEEPYLCRMYKNMLKKAIIGDDTMNYSYYEGKDIDVMDLMDTSQTLPFFADKRLMLIENSGFLKTSSDKVADVIKNSPETTIFIFVENEVDKRNKVYKTINEFGYSCEMKQQTEDALTVWCLRLLTEANKKITRDDMQLFLSKTGSGMDNIYQELQKLITYTDNKEVISKEDIEAICTTQTQDRIFDMINAIASKNRNEAISLYSDLLLLREPPMKILALLGKQFAQLMAVKEMIISGYGKSVVAEKLGIRPFFVGKYISQAGRFSLEQLKNAVSDCVNADMMVKTGQSEDTYVVEMIILKYSR